MAHLSARENPFFEDGELKQNVIAQAYHEGDLDFVGDALDWFLKTKADDGKIINRVLSNRYLGEILTPDFEKLLKDAKGHFKDSFEAMLANRFQYAYQEF